MGLGECGGWDGDGVEGEEEAGEGEREGKGLGGWSGGGALCAGLAWEVGQDSPGCWVEGGGRVVVDHHGYFEGWEVGGEVG